MYVCTVILDTQRKIQWCILSLERESRAHQPQKRHLIWRLLFHKKAIANGGDSQRDDNKLILTKTLYLFFSAPEKV